MSTTFASKMAEAEQQYSKAQQRTRIARQRLSQLSSHWNACKKAKEYWAENKSPAVVNSPDRPTWRALDDAGSVTADGRVITKGRQKLRLKPDIELAPPPSEERISQAQDELAEAEKAESEAYEVFRKARAQRAEEVSSAEPTGFVAANNNYRLNGTVYSAGDPISPDGIPPRKFEQLLRVGHIRRTSF